MNAISDCIFILVSYTMRVLCRWMKRAVLAVTLLGRSRSCFTALVICCRYTMKTCLKENGKYIKYHSCKFILRHNILEDRYSTTKNWQHYNTVSQSFALSRNQLREYMSTVLALFHYTKAEWRYSSVQQNVLKTCYLISKKYIINVQLPQKSFSIFLHAQTARHSKQRKN